MKDRISKQAYDRGYDDGARAAREPEYCAHNPYSGKNRRWFWDMGCEDGGKGRPRKMSQTEAHERDHRRLRLLEAVYKAAQEVAEYEHFDMNEVCARCLELQYGKPCQDARERLHAALTAVQASDEGKA